MSATFAARVALSQAPFPTASTDRDVLLALFRSTDGENWDDKDRWGTDEELSTWYGIVVEEGRVAGISVPPFNKLKGT